jgi:lysophospholipase L1-like esterase
MRFVALGDSITAGFGDPMPGGLWRGWSSLLADALGAEFHNLATSGALTHTVAEQQLPRALELRPHVAGVVVGVNDTLRNTFDAERLERTLDHAVAALRACGTTVLTARLPDPGRMFGLPGILPRPLARRIRVVNAAADVVAARHPLTYDRRMWSVDRLHPSERGHRLLATSYFDLMAEGLGVPVSQRPLADRQNPGADPAGQDHVAGDARDQVAVRQVHGSRAAPGEDGVHGTDDGPGSARRPGHG